MARTLLRGGAFIQDGTIQRDDLDTTTAGQALLRKLIAGTGITLSSTGTDPGTGDVTVNIGTVPVANGGTGQTTGPAALTALGGYLAVTSAAGTTTLTAASAKTIYVTGSTTQTVVLPDVTTLQLGWTYQIINANSTGAVTVQSSGLNAFALTLGAGNICEFTCIAITGTGTASWQQKFVGGTARSGNGASIVYSAQPLISQLMLSASNAVTAGTNAQGQGALTESVNVITTAANNPSGVTLPTPVGAAQVRLVTIINKGANPVNVYPASGGTIDALAANAAISLPVGGVMTFMNSSTTQWYSDSAQIVRGQLLRAPQILTSGTSYTTPAGCTAIYVELIGGGGAGGGLAATTTTAGAAGAGAGGYAAKYFAVTPLTAYTYAIGAAGAAGAAGANAGGNGTSTTFTVSATTVTAGGGTGGAGGTPAAGGAGGTAMNGDINIVGAPGEPANSAANAGGNGGNGFFGGAGVGGVTANGGAASTNSGAGGGGGANNASGVARAGGAGAAGFIRIWEYA